MGLLNEKLREKTFFYWLLALKNKIFISGTNCFFYYFVYFGGSMWDMGCNCFLAKGKNNCSANAFRVIKVSNFFCWGVARLCNKNCILFGYFKWSVKWFCHCILKSSSTLSLFRSRSVKKGHHTLFYFKPASRGIKDESRVARMKKEAPKFWSRCLSYVD